MEEHWRDIQQSEYLASWDFKEDTEELTIKEIRKEEAKLLKKEIKVVAYFEEEYLKSGTKVKPMILNSGNLQFMQEKTGIFHQTQWNGIKIEISAIQNNTSKGGKRRLKISKIISKIEFNIEEFLEISDKAEAKRVASSQHKFMSEAQMQQAKQHIDTLK